MLPVAYNEARSTAQPTPSNDPNHEQRNDANDDDNEETKLVLPTVQMDDTDIMALDGIVADESNESNSGFESIISNGALNAYEDHFDGNEYNETNQSDGPTNGVDSFEPNQSIEEEESVEANETNETQQKDGQNNDSDIPIQQNEAVNGAVKMFMMDNGQIRVTQTLKDMEVTFIRGEVLRPMKQCFEIKVNDILSGNFPFQENVCFVVSFHIFHAY